MEEGGQTKAACSLGLQWAERVCGVRRIYKMRLHGAPGGPGTDTHTPAILPFSPRHCVPGAPSCTPRGEFLPRPPGPAARPAAPVHSSASPPGRRSPRVRVVGSNRQVRGWLCGAVQDTVSTPGARVPRGGSTGSGSGPPTPSSCLVGHQKGDAGSADALPGVDPRAPRRLSALVPQWC